MFDRAIRCSGSVGQLCLPCSGGGANESKIGVSLEGHPISILPPMAPNFMRLLRSARGTLRPKHHALLDIMLKLHYTGNCFNFSTYRDESFNGVLARTLALFRWVLLQPFCTCFAVCHVCANTHACSYGDECGRVRTPYPRRRRCANARTDTGMRTHACTPQQLAAERGTHAHHLAAPKLGYIHM